MIKYHVQDPDDDIFVDGDLLKRYDIVLENVDRPDICMGYVFDEGLAYQIIDSLNGSSLVEE